MRGFAKDLLVMGTVGARSLWTAKQVVRRHSWWEFSGRSLIVTGGSRGTAAFGLLRAL